VISLPRAHGHERGGLVEADVEVERPRRDLLNATAVGVQHVRLLDDAFGTRWVRLFSRLVPGARHTCGAAQRDPVDVEQLAVDLLDPREELGARVPGAAEHLDERAELVVVGERLGTAIRASPSR
jgi:hypothetical protein